MTKNTFIGIKDYHNPLHIYGYLPIDEDLLIKLQNINQDIFICYSINESLPGTQIGLLFSMEKENSYLYITDNTKSMLDDIHGYQKEMPKMEETLH